RNSPIGQLWKEIGVTPCRFTFSVANPIAPFEFVPTFFRARIMRVITLDAHEQSWPLDKPFRTARGASTAARVVVVTVSDGQHTGRGEAAPITRYKQSVASVLAQIELIA